MKALPLVLATLACVIFAFDAHAYIDPGTGSAIIQALVAAVLGAGLGLKLFWRRIKSVVGSFFSRSPSEESTD